MARHGGVYCNVDIFVKCRYFCTVLISPLFSNSTFPLNALKHTVSHFLINCIAL